MRRKALDGENIKEMVIEAFDGVVGDIMDDCVAEGIHPEDWDIDGLRERARRVFGLGWEESDAELRDHSQAEIRDRLLSDALVLYQAKEKDLGEEPCRQVERMLLLQFTDQLWKDHLLAMDRLRDGIGLRGYGQRNPLLEYKKEGFNMYMMMNALRDEMISSRLLQVELNAMVEGAAAAPTKSAARSVALGQKATLPADAAAFQPTLEKSAEAAGNGSACLCNQAGPAQERSLSLRQWAQVQEMLLRGAGNGCACSGSGSQGQQWLSARRHACYVTCSRGTRGGRQASSRIPVAAIRSSQQGWPERNLSLWQWKEVQEVLSS